MDPVLDIFTDDVFSISNLRVLTANTPYVPQYLGQLGLFTPHPLTGTDKVLIYEQDGVVRVIPTTERGGPDIQAIRQTGRFIGFQCKRISEKDQVNAGELLGISNTALPRTIRLRTAAELLQERLMRMKNNKALTLEKHRFGAMAGVLYDADGTTVLYDYFAEFGVATPTPITLNLSTWTEAETAQQITDLIWRPMQIALADRLTPQTVIGALAGDGAWSKLMKNPGFRKIWELEMSARAIARAANPLVQPQAWMEVDFGGVRWINYRGTNDGSTIALGTNEVRFFPIGARDVFDVYWAPGETLLDIDKPGQPEYTYIQPDVRTNMPTHIEVFLRTYPLFICVFPKALMKGTAA